MLRILAFIALAFGFALPTLSRAGPVEIVIAPAEVTAETPIGLFPWSLSLNVPAGVEVGALNIVVSGFSAVEFNLANPGISAPDSVFVPGVFGDDRASLIVSNSENGGMIATGASTGVLLATLFTAFDCVALPAACPVLVHDHPGYFGGTLFDPNLRLLTDYQIYASPAALVTDDPFPDPGGGGTGGGGTGGGGSGGGGSGGGGPEIPEPTELALISLALLGFGALRLARG